MVALDAPDEALNDRGLADVEGEISIDVEGTYGRQVGFNGLWLKPSLAEVGNPLDDGCLSGRQDGVIGVEVLRVEANKLDERFLTGTVGRAG